MNQPTKGQIWRKHNQHGFTDWIILVSDKEEGYVVAKRINSPKSIGSIIIDDYKSWADTRNFISEASREMS
jgi:hypothetical protein